MNDIQSQAEVSLRNNDEQNEQEYRIDANPPPSSSNALFYDLNFQQQQLNFSGNNSNSSKNDDDKGNQAASQESNGSSKPISNGDDRRRSSSVLRILSNPFSHRGSVTNNNKNNNHESSQEIGNSNSNGERRRSSVSNMLWGRKSSLVSKLQSSNGEIPNINDININNNEGEDGNEKQDADIEEKFDTSYFGAQDVNIDKQSSKISSTNQLKIQTTTSATKRNSSAPSPLPSSGEFDFIPPPPETPPPENEPITKRPSLSATSGAPNSGKSGNATTSPIQATRKFIDGSNATLALQTSNSLDAASIPPPPATDEEDEEENHIDREEESDVVEPFFTGKQSNAYNQKGPSGIGIQSSSASGLTTLGPKDIIRQQAERVPKGSFMHRPTRGTSQHSIPSHQTTHSQKPSRPTLLDLQSKLAEVNNNVDQAGDIITPKIINTAVAPVVIGAGHKSSPSSSSLGFGTERTSNLSRGASGSGFGRPSYLTFDGCDENDYVRCSTFLAPPSFQMHSLATVLEPNQVAAVIENSLTSMTSLKRAAAFHPQVGDVIVASAPRCGQTPILQLLDTLLLQDDVDNVHALHQAELERMPTNADEVGNILDASLAGEIDPALLPLPFRAPWIESSVFDGYRLESFTQKKNGRRVFKTHLSSSLLKPMIKPGLKFVIAARDPIDVRLSFYRYIRKLYRRSEAEEVRPFDNDYNLDSFARVPVAPCTISNASGPMVETVTITKAYQNTLHEGHEFDDVGYEADLVAWIKAAEQYPQNVLIVFYEELCTQPMKVCAKIAEFLDSPGKSQIQRKKIEAAVKRIMKSPLFPGKIITKCLASAATKKTKVQLRIEELERKERATLGVRKIEQEEEPDANKRKHKRNTSNPKMETRKSRGSTLADSVAGRARGSSLESTADSKGSIGCLQLGHRLFDDLDIEWMDETWESQVRARTAAAISYEHLYLKHLGINFPFGHRERPKKVIIERAKAKHISEQKSKGIAQRFSSLFIG